MREENQSLFLPFSFLFFILSRLFIFLGLDPYLTDVGLYFEQARAWAAGKKPYTDFFYPYPPLSLPMVAIPSWLGGDTFEVYRSWFGSELLILDLILNFSVLVFLKKKFQFTDRALGFYLCLTSVLTLFQGHLIYDRIDLGLTLINSLILIVSVNGLHEGWALLLSNAGFLFKFLSFIPAGFLAMVGRPRFTMKWVLYLVPGVTFLIALERLIYPGILSHLFQHQQRGIQVESVWATPFLILAVTHLRDLKVVSAFGAQQLDDAGVPSLYLEASRYLGWILFLIWGGLILLKKRVCSEPRLKVLTMLAVFLVFISTQRVFSPQYLIWLIPFFGMAIPLYGYRKSWIGGAVLVYGLTFIEFDLGYWELTRMNPVFVTAVALRNGILILLTLSILKEWFKTTS